MNRRAARHIRQGIRDARARVFPWWSTMGRMTLSAPWDSPLQDSVAAAPRSAIYRAAYERTAARMPAPRPPKGGSGISQ